LSYAILFDATRCKACERCVAACVEADGGNPDGAAADRATIEDGLSARRLSTVIPVSDGRFSRKSCMHCLDPACVAACLVGGIEKSPEGPVIYDPDKCIGCRYCMLACPFHVPRYEWGETAPFMRKCSMCIDRIRSGKIPACVEACPNDAMVFGSRDGLLARAWETIRGNPRRYLPRVWGEKEWGGTSVLAISDVDLAPVGWPREDLAPIPARTDPLIHGTPAIGLSVLLGTWALSTIIGRRQRLAASGDDEEHEENPRDRA
jgi:formate dehydrogenase iron-sulfur subunit